jgi:tetratricopeptide (TPR) repeat protein
MRVRRTWTMAVLGLCCFGASIGFLSAQELGNPQPTAPSPSGLTKAEWLRAEDLKEQLKKLTKTGRLKEALKAASTLAELFDKQLGTKDFRSADAHWDAEALRRMLKLGAASQKMFTDLGALEQRAAALEAKGDYETARPLRQEALTTERDLLGDEHPKTADGYNNLGANLNGLGRYADAEKNLRKALKLKQRLLGEKNPGTALGYSNLAVTLSFQKRFTEAEKAYVEALTGFHVLLGDTHPLTVNTRESLAFIQDEQGRYAEAERSYRFVLTVYRRLRGEEDPKTANSYHRLARTLYFEGIYGEAEEHCRRALALRRQFRGEEDVDTVDSYGLLAAILNQQLRFSEAEPICARRLALCLKVYGDAHVDTAESYNLLASNLSGQGRYAEAEQAWNTTLDLRRRFLGEEHRETVDCYGNIAMVLHQQRKYAEAETFGRRAVKQYEILLGKSHADDTLKRSSLLIAVAASYHNLASTLDELGRQGEAEVYSRKALTTRIRVLGEEHPNTVNAYAALAVILYHKGEYTKAEEVLRKAALPFERARDQIASSSLDRVAFSSACSPLLFLAALLARNGKSDEAWEWLERSLARGTSAELLFRRGLTGDDRSHRVAIARRLAHLDTLIEQRGALTVNTEAERKEHESLLTERRQLQVDLDVVGGTLSHAPNLNRTELLEEREMVREGQRIYGVASGRPSTRAAVQSALPDDAAFITWVDIFPPSAQSSGLIGEHWAVLLRAFGSPTWVRLNGSGRGGAWTEDDYLLTDALLATLDSPKSNWRPLASKLRIQRLQPLQEYLAAKGGRPAVRRLIVLPSVRMSGLPVEALCDNLTISYALSATLYCQQRQEPPVTGIGLFAVADPSFEGLARVKPMAKQRSAGGLLVTAVAPGSKAATAGLKPGDVLLRYGGAELGSLDDLSRQVELRTKDREVTIAIWREGRTSERVLLSGNLGVVVVDEPNPIAIANHHNADNAPPSGGDDENWRSLPGSRAEVEALRHLFVDAGTEATVLTDAEANTKRLDDLAGSGALGKFRYLHMATHGVTDNHFPLGSAIILARAPTPPAMRSEVGLAADNDRLSADHILRTWQLHADMVTLSACETALGKFELGEGFIGFTQALLLAGSRSVCLSLWKVDDAATALLMERFYQNLLGRRSGLKEPMKKAPALAEAKAWLRALPRDEALKRLARLREGAQRGKGRPLQPLLPEVPTLTGNDVAPYAHPFYWAAFIILGDPD